jgi:hypothetical protein
MKNQLFHRVCELCVRLAARLGGLLIVADQILQKDWPAAAVILLSMLMLEFYWLDERKRKNLLRIVPTNG